MRMVLDTNVLISALINPDGSPHQLLDYWERSDFTLVTSEEQINELRRVLEYERLRPYISHQSAESLLALIPRTAELVTDLPQVDHSPDPADNVIIATALAGNATHLVTGDRRHLLSIDDIPGVSVITPRRALALLGHSVD